MNASEEAGPWAGGWAVIARIGDRRIAFAADDVDAIIAVPPLWRPPTAPPPVMGFLPYEGAAMPVLDGARLLGLGSRERPDFYAHILILPGLGGAGSGLLVDRADDMVDLPADAVLPLDPADTLNSCAVAIVETGDGRAHLLSAALLLAASEAATLAAHREEAMRRMVEWGVPA